MKMGLPGLILFTIAILGSNGQMNELFEELENVDEAMKGLMGGNITGGANNITAALSMMTGLASLFGGKIPQKAYPPPPPYGGYPPPPPYGGYPPPPRYTPQPASYNESDYDSEYGPPPPRYPYPSPPPEYELEEDIFPEPEPEYDLEAMKSEIESLKLTVKSLKVDKEKLVSEHSQDVLALTKQVMVASVNGSDLNMNYGDAVKFLQLTEIQNLKKTVETLEKGREELIRSHLQDIEVLMKDKEAMENNLRDKLEEANYLATNKNVLNRFMRNILYHNDKKSGVCVETIAAQAEKLKIQSHLMTKYQELISIQDASMKSLKPTLSYVIRNNSRLEFQTDSDGTLLEVAPCQCLPVTNDPAVIFTGLEFTCPGGTVAVDSLQAVNSLDCPAGVCPLKIQDNTCGDYYELPWTGWTECSSSNCLFDSYRERKYRKDDKVSSKFEGQGARPLILNSTEEVELYLPGGGQLGVFAVGGGGGADDTNSGSSGFFTYDVLPITESGTYQVSVTVGTGGQSRGQLGGQPSVVDVVGVGVVRANGGGGRGEAGWSGGSSEKGGANGSSGQDMSNGSGETLPRVCGDGVSLTPGLTGSYDNDGTGGGGVIVNGQMPYQIHAEDGEGYGAGGGEDDYDGYDGVVVLMFCP